MHPILAALVAPRFASAAVAQRRAPLRVRYFVLLGLLLMPAFIAGLHLGVALVESRPPPLPAPQANMLEVIVNGLVANRWPAAARYAAFAGAWLVGGLAAGVVLLLAGGLLLGALLRDRAIGRVVGALAALFAPIFSLAVSLVLAHYAGRAGVAGLVLGGLLAVLVVVRWALLAWGAARQATRPLLPPAGCAAVFSLGSVLVWRLANEVAFLPGIELQLVLPDATPPGFPFWL